MTNTSVFSRIHKIASTMKYQKRKLSCRMMFKAQAKEYTSTKYSNSIQNMTFTKEMSTR